MNGESLYYTLSLSIVLLCIAAGPELKQVLGFLAFLDGGYATTSLRGITNFVLFSQEIAVTPHLVHNYTRRM